MSDAPAIIVRGTQPQSDAQTVVDLPCALSEQRAGVGGGCGLLGGRPAIQRAVQDRRQGIKVAVGRRQQGQIGGGKLRREIAILAAADLTKVVGDARMEIDCASHPLHCLVAGRCNAEFLAVLQIGVAGSELMNAVELGDVIVVVGIVAPESKIGDRGQV